MNFINKFQRFMYGRYGVDELYLFLVKVLFCIMFINLFFNNSFFKVLEGIISVTIFYRFFSKKIYKRSDENQLYLKIKKIFLNFFANIKRNICDKGHAYRICFGCGTTLKLGLPKSRGIKHVTCPDCGKRRALLSLRCRKKKG